MDWKGNEKPKEKARNRYSLTNPNDITRKGITHMGGYLLAFSGAFHKEVMKVNKLFILSGGMEVEQPKRPLRYGLECLPLPPDGENTFQTQQVGVGPL